MTVQALWIATNDLQSKICLVEDYAFNLVGLEGYCLSSHGQNYQFRCVLWPPGYTKRSSKSVQHLLIVNVFFHHTILDHTRLCKRGRIYSGLDVKFCRTLNIRLTFHLISTCFTFFQMHWMDKSSNLKEEMLPWNNFYHYWQKRKAEWPSG